ncbi:hypothetical protein DM860_009481 [Cuscuta australis]|uniref:DUF3511 domain-containing protein n=1 Tax=Cuscuta australis TaxID=267555 RepID=A0A328DJ28_9ASTE|nr:hypothetical protein DM860_009481 [Cuscuta australis]
MEEMRSKSYNSNYGHTNTTIFSNNNENPKPENLRCHSASSSSYSSSHHPISNPNNKTNYYHHSREDDFKNKKGKPTPPSSSSAGWVLGDPAEMQRKKRVTSYKAYTVEGKLKGSLKKSFRWIKMRVKEQNKSKTLSKSQNRNKWLLNSVMPPSATPAPQPLQCPYHR